MGGQLAWQDLFLGSSFDPNSPKLYFGVLRGAKCQPVGFRVAIVVAEESC